MYQKMNKATDLLELTKKCYSRWLDLLKSAAAIMGFGAHVKDHSALSSIKEDKLARIHRLNQLMLRSIKKDL